MYERIKELADEAWVYQVRVYETDGVRTFSEKEKVFSKEKFAELIVRDTLDQVAEFDRLTKAYLKQGIDPEIDVTKEILKNYGFTRFPIGVE